MGHARSPKTPKRLSTLMPKTAVLTVKHLHDDTGQSVRRAGASKRPIPITDRGKLVAVLANPALVRPYRRKRVLLTEYETMLEEAPSDHVQTALDELRGDR